MAEQDITVEVDYKELEKELSQFDKEMPNIARKLMRAVNNEAKKKIRQEARSRGYKARKPMGYGDAGYSKNLKSFADKGYQAKIMMTNNAFHYKFIEYGANVQPQHSPYLTFKIGDQFYRSRGFTLPADPLIHPIANAIWGSSKASEIMDSKMQEEMNKQFK
jgi:hypothetical protein